MTPARALVLDFDGVILESADIKTDAFRETFAAYPEHVPAIVAYHVANSGLPRFCKFEWIYRELLRRPLPADELRALNERFAAYAVARVLASPFVPGARETLASLAGRLPLYVASGTPHDELEMIVERRGLARVFARVWGGPTRKPAAIAEVRAAHGLRPDEVAFVGDGQSDLAAGVESGARFVARAASRPSWLPAGVPCVADLRDLPPLLGLDAA